MIFWSFERLVIDFRSRIFWVHDTLVKKVKVGDQSDKIEEREDERLQVYFSKEYINKENFLPRYKFIDLSISGLRWQVKG